MSASAFSARIFLVLGLVLVPILAQDVHGQSARPVPHPLLPPPHYELAVEHQTRTAEGMPGRAYWQNRASYEIDAVLSPATSMLRASGRVRYFNESPGALERIYLYLRQNLHRPDAIRNREVPLTDGLRLNSVRIGDAPLVERTSFLRPGYSVDGTILRVELPDVLAPGDSVDLHLSWSFEVPGLGTPRMGQDGEVFFLGFWYPQMAVYDDVVGWNIDPYMGAGEFYMDFADYEVRLTVPARWLVAATGVLQNPAEVLSPTVRERLASLATADSVVHVVTAADPDPATADSETGTLTWHFRAERARDFAFGTSARYVWDATLAHVPGRDPVEIHALYRPDRSAWDQDATFGRWSVEWLSERLTPYPYPHMTMVEGLIGGGMEYPMITLIGGTRTPPSLFRTTFHEIVHMWYPMLLSQNEKHFGWMDEGLVSLLSDEAQKLYWDEEDGYYHRYYDRVAGTGLEMPSMRHSDQFPTTTSARTAALYGKPTVALQALEGLVGKDRFDEALRTYTERWLHRKPYPWDFFRTFNDVLGEDLDWFWSAYFFETWTLDHAITSVESRAEGIEVTVTDQDLLPYPAVVRLTYADDRTETRTIPVAHWLSGETETAVTFPPGEAVRVELDPSGVAPDLNRENDVWEGTEGGGL